MFFTWNYGMWTVFFCSSSKSLGCKCTIHRSSRFISMCAHLFFVFVVRMCACLFVGFFCWLFIFKICSPFSHTINFNQFKIVWNTHLSHSYINCETQSHDNAERKMAFWMRFMIVCCACVHGAHISFTMMTPMMVMRIIFCTIYDWFGLRFVLHFLPHSNRVFHHAPWHLVVKDFYIPKQMMNIWFVFSRLNLGCILMCEKRATKSFARICVHLKYLYHDASAASTHKNLYPPSRFCLQWIHWQTEFQRRKSM